MNELYIIFFNQLVTALGAVPVYDHVPHNAKGLLVVLEPIEDRYSDTDDQIGFNSSIKVHVYSEYNGSKECAETQETIFNALHRWSPLDTANYAVSNITQDYKTIVTEPDGKTRHGVQQFNLIYNALTV